MHPKIIQGGMGVAVSSWALARAVAKEGQLGVVSGTALDAVLARRLQLGDLDGSMKLALEAFPIPDMAKRVWDRYFIAGGKAPDAPFKSKPLPSVEPSQALLDLMIVGSFAEVWLARQGHGGKVGINLLEKIQPPTIPTLYGAMLAGVDYVLMGAGIPRAIPGILDQLVAGLPAELRIEAAGAEAAVMKFDTPSFGQFDLKRPIFLAIVAAASLAQVLAKKTNPPVDGFVIEGPTAGGHNAPPRGGVQLTPSGEPIYGERDLVDLAKFRELGLPFWLAGSFGGPNRLKEALAEGAQGIQVGTAFAFCEESGVEPSLKREVIKMVQEGRLSVFTDPVASPTGFPFKVVQVAQSLSDPDVAESRQRVCDLGYLREAYRDTNGKLQFRCPAEPVEDYVRKGGDIENTKGRMCVCNGLVATIGMPQIRNGESEPCLITAGDDLVNIARFLPKGADRYTAADVIKQLLN